MNKFESLNNIDSDNINIINQDLKIAYENINHDTNWNWSNMDFLTFGYFIGNISAKKVNITDSLLKDVFS